jgi:hypothetical protein
MMTETKKKKWNKKLKKDWNEKKNIWEIVIEGLNWKKQTSIKKIRMK